MPSIFDKPSVQSGTSQPASIAQTGSSAKMVQGAGRVQVSIADPSTSIQKSVGDINAGFIGVGKGLVSVAENLPLVGGIAKPLIGFVGSVADATIGQGVSALEKIRIGDSNLAQASVNALEFVGQPLGWGLDAISAPGRFVEQKIAEARIKNTQTGKQDLVSGLFGAAPKDVMAMVQGGASIEQAAEHLSTTNAGYSENGLANLAWSLLLDPVNFLAPGVGYVAKMGKQASVFARIANRAALEGITDVAQVAEAQAFLGKWGWAGKVHDATVGVLSYRPQRFTSTLAKEVVAATPKVYNMKTVGGFMDDVAAAGGVDVADRLLKNFAVTSMNAVKSGAVRAVTAIRRSGSEDLANTIVHRFWDDLSNGKSVDEVLATDVYGDGNMASLLKRIGLEDTDIATLSAKVQEKVGVKRLDELVKDPEIRSIVDSLASRHANWTVANRGASMKMVADVRVRADSRLATEEMTRVLFEAKNDVVALAADPVLGVQELTKYLVNGGGLSAEEALTVAQQQFARHAGDTRALTDILAMARGANFGQAARKLAAVRSLFPKGDPFAKLTITSQRSLTRAEAEAAIKRVDELKAIIKSGGVGSEDSGILESTTKTKFTIKPSTEDPNEVLNANFLFGKIDGNKNVDISQINGTINLSQPSELKRVEELASQISSEDGFISRIIIDDSGNVIEGQHRLEAMRMLGETSIPVVVIRNLENYYDIDAMEKAVRSIANLRSENVSQLVKEAINAIEEGGGVSAALSNYRMPAELQPAFEAAIKASAPKSSSRISVAAAKAELKAESDRLVQGYDEFAAQFGTNGLHTYDEVFDFLKKAPNLTVRELSQSQRARIAAEKVSDDAVRQVAALDQELSAMGYRLGVAPDDDISRVTTMATDHFGNERFIEMTMPFADTIDHVAIDAIDNAGAALRPSRLGRIFDKVSRPFGAEVTKNVVAERFVTRMVGQYGISVNRARRILADVNNLAASKGVQPKALLADSNELEQIFRREMGDDYGKILDKGSTAFKEVLEAAAGDLSSAGLTSGFTGRVKAVFPAITLLTDKIYPEVRFGVLNPFFNLVLERIETATQKLTYGIKKEAASEFSQEITGSTLRKAYLDPRNVNREIADGQLYMASRANRNTAAAVETATTFKGRVEQRIKGWLPSKDLLSVQRVRSEKEIARDIMSDKFAADEFVDLLNQAAPGKLEELAIHYGVSDAKGAVQLLLEEYMIHSDPIRLAEYVAETGAKVRGLVSKELVAKMGAEEAQALADAVVGAYEVAILKGSRAADKAQYFASQRTWLERSLNHPFLGIYPYSYMTQKVIPMMMRLMFLTPNPFGTGRLVMPGLGYAKYQNFLEYANNRVNSDETLLDQLLQNDAILYVFSTLLPATPDNMGFSAPSWLRRGFIQPALRGQELTPGQIAPTLTEAVSQLGRGTVLGQGRTMLEGLQAVEDTAKVNQGVSDFIQSSAQDIQETVLSLRGN